MKNKVRPQKIWIDADACPRPIKEITFKASIRESIPLVCVANSNQVILTHPLISLIVVKKGADIADQYIIEHIGPSDLVITADIPLASQVVLKKAVAINPRGEIYTEENIGEILSYRDFCKELRDSGIVTGGPAPFSAKDTQEFANSLNQLLQR